MFKNRDIIIKFCFVILINFILIYIYDFKFDLTKDKRHTISSETTSILRNLDDKIFIKIYLEGDLSKDLQHLQSEVISLLTSFKVIAGDKFDYEFINPDKESDDIQKLYMQIKKAGVLSRNIQSKEGFKVSQSIIFPGAVIYYKDQTKAVNFLEYSNSNFVDNQEINTSIENLEYKFISAIYRVIQIANNKREKIAFLNGNGELSEKELFDLTNSNDDENLQYHYDIEFFDIKSFKIDTSNKNSGDATISIIDYMANNFKAIIIAKPTIPFNPLEKFIIDQYLMKGGRIIWFIDMVLADLDSLMRKPSFIAYKNELNLDDMFNHYGVNLGSNLIEDLKSTSIPIINSNKINRKNYFPWPYYLLIKSNNNHLIVNNIGNVHAKFVSSVDTFYSKFNKKTILLNSSKNSRVNPTPAKISFQIAIKPPPISSFNKVNIPIGVLIEGKFISFFKDFLRDKSKSLTKSKETKMIFFADGDIPKNRVVNEGKTWSPLGYDEFSKKIYSGNKNIVMNSIHYLCDDIKLFHLKEKQRLLATIDKQKILKYRTLIQLINIIFPIILVLIFHYSFRLYKYKKYS